MKNLALSLNSGAILDVLLKILMGFSFLACKMGIM